MKSKPAPLRPEEWNAIRTMRSMPPQDFLELLFSAKVNVDKDGWIVLEDDGDTD